MPASGKNPTWSSLHLYLQEEGLKEYWVRGLIVEAILHISVLSRHLAFLNSRHTWNTCYHMYARIHIFLVSVWNGKRGTHTWNNEQPTIHHLAEKGIVRNWHVYFRQRLASRLHFCPKKGMCGPPLLIFRWKKRRSNDRTTLFVLTNTQQAFLLIQNIGEKRRHIILHVFHCIGTNM